MKKTLVLALAAIMVLGVAGAAFAETKTIEGTSSGTPPAWSAAGTVNINASVNPKITLTLGVDTDLVADGVLNLDWSITPDTAEPTAKTVDLIVDSNKNFTIARTPDDGDPAVVTSLEAAGISFDFAASTLPLGGTKGENVAFTDTVNLSATNWWSVAPGSYAGSILYTVTQ